MKRKVKLILSIILILIIFILTLNLKVFAEAKYFSIEVPEGYLILDGDFGDIKLSVVKPDNKLNFNIQVVSTEEYFEYSEEGLKDLIRISGKDMTQYSVSGIDGKISNINKYPCYELIYNITSKNTNKIMSIRQIYIYEDTYTYTITIGGESKELVTSNEIKKALDSFTLVKYERNKVKSLTEEEKKEIRKEIRKEEILKEDSFKGKIYRIIDDFKEMDIRVQISIIITIFLVLISIIIVIIKIKEQIKDKKEKREAKKEMRAKRKGKRKK